MIQGPGNAKWERQSFVSGGPNVDFTNMGQCKGEDPVQTQHDGPGPSSPVMWTQTDAALWCSWRLSEHLQLYKVQRGFTVGLTKVNKIKYFIDRIKYSYKITSLDKQVNWVLAQRCGSVSNNIWVWTFSQQCLQGRSTDPPGPTESRNSLVFVQQNTGFRKPFCSFFFWFLQKLLQKHI